MNNTITYTIMASLLYTFIINGYLFLLMITMDPRIWGYSDYPQIVQDKVSPPSRQEKRAAILVSIPFLLLMVGLPIFSVLNLRFNIEGSYSIWIGFIHLFALFLSASFGDMVILDWLIISKITPDFVVIEGTEKDDYKDFSTHFKGHLKASIFIIPFLLIIAFIVSLI